MRQTISVKVRRGDKLVTEAAILWIDELSPEYRHGKNKKDKTLRGKREKQEQFIEEAQRKREEGTG